MFLCKVTVHIDSRNLLFKEVNILDSQRYPFTSLLDILHFCLDKDEKAVLLQILKFMKIPLDNVNSPFKLVGYWEKPVIEKLY